MRSILVFEYITGGGLIGQALPLSLLTEGQLMLDALLHNLRQLPQLSLSVLLDGRAAYLVNSQGATAIIINDKNYLLTFTKLVLSHDAAWIIAPENDNILANLCAIVTDLHKTLLTSPRAAVALAADKLATYQRLKQYNIATVSTQLLTEIGSDLDFLYHEWVIKPIDGVGCEQTFIIRNLPQLINLNLPADKFIIQPHIEGKKTSLSCLCNRGQGWLICINEQFFDTSADCYKLTAISVNSIDKTLYYQRLLTKIAHAFPQLWGYVGIDLIETKQAVFVLEINPRLTSSFAGIEQALGINIAEQVLLLTENKVPLLRAKQHKTVLINLTP